jgi:hypothetical protein
MYVVDLAYYFSYLDLICTDCGIFAETTSNYLVEAAKKEYEFFNMKHRLERVKVRLERAECFLDYLRKEEMRERDLYALGMPEPEMFTHKSLTAFSSERARVLSSAKKQSDGVRPRRVPRGH